MRTITIAVMIGIAFIVLAVIVAVWPRSKQDGATLVASQTPLPPGRYRVGPGFDSTYTFEWDGTYLNKLPKPWAEGGFLTGECQEGWFRYNATDKKDEAFKLRLTTDGKYTTITAYDFQKAPWIDKRFCAPGNPPVMLMVQRGYALPLWVLPSKEATQFWIFEKIGELSATAPNTQPPWAGPGYYTFQHPPPFSQY